MAELGGLAEVVRETKNVEDGSLEREHGDGQLRYQ